MKSGILLLLASGGCLATPLYNHDLAARQPASATVTVTPTSALKTAHPCAQVSHWQSSIYAANPSATAAYVNATVATNCLNSIPVNKDDAKTLLQSFRTYLEFHSNKEYLKNPPAGYANPAFDLDDAINQISKKADAGTYRSEVAFQKDIYYALQQTYDGHLYWFSDILTGVFSYTLPNFSGLASVSADGLQDPQMFFASDLVDVSETPLVPRKDFKPSPVVRLNGVNVTEAVETLGLLASTQDPDARYNTMLFVLGNIQHTLGQLTASRIPPDRDWWQFDFANGSTVRLPWAAQVLQDFTNVTDGRTAYHHFAPFAGYYSDEDINDFYSTPTTTSSVHAKRATETSHSQSTAYTSHAQKANQTTAQPTEATRLPNIPYFPFPVVKDDANLIAGYFLNDTRYKDVAVLQVTGFQPPSTYEDDFVAPFSETLATFLSKATKEGKKKLIVDLQGNGGGIIDLGTDMYVQLFPNQNPDMSANMRRSVGMDIIVSSASAEVDALDVNATAADIEAWTNAPWSYQYDVDPSNRNINSTKQLLDGITFDNTKFTAFFQTNYSDPLASYTTGFQITQPNASSTPPFAPENIIVLTDGTCASTCTSFSEHLKNKAGVQFIVVGGRPRHQPVQAVGGVKGSQVFEFDEIYRMHDLFYNATDAEIESTNGTEWDHFSYYPIARTGASAQQGDPLAGITNGGGVNGRNSFRIGDSSHTPLQFVYEAADCRIWFTPEMLYDPVALWNRVADVAFYNRTGSKFTSPYCVAGSTGHPTSISGGWKRGTLGPQDQGKKEAADPVFKKAPWSVAAVSNLLAQQGGASGTSSFMDVKCDDYAGEYWFLQIMCKAYKSIPS